MFPTLPWMSTSNCSRPSSPRDDEKKQTADRLWQEGTNIFNQGRPSDALTKFKESLTYWQDATRAKYVTDLEGRRTQAQTLRDEGAQLQQQNRLTDAIARYNESLQLWPDPKLKEHIAALRGKAEGGPGHRRTARPRPSGSGTRVRDSSSRTASGRPSASTVRA